MATSYKWSVLIPKNKSDRIPLLFIVIELILEVAFEAFIILPSLFEPFTLGYNIHLAFGLFCLFNFVGNLILSIVTELTSGSTILPSVLKPGWSYCAACTLNTPPRASHCHSCERCVLKRDHHCVFTGKCVGYNNHRYYMMMLVYFCVGSLYATYLNMDYTYEIMHVLNWKVVIAFFAPVLGWVIGLTQSLSFFVCLQCSTCILSSLLSVGILYYHGALIARGQTTKEWRKRIRGYDRGWRQNFLEVFGTRWYLVWLSPWISSPLPGDGINFLRRDRSENIKDM